jgi:hypothetical protein
VAAGSVRRPVTAAAGGRLPGPGLTDDHLAASTIFLLHPGGPGMYPLLLTIGVVLAALAGLLRRDRRRLVLAGWTAALVSLRRRWSRHE